jgi:hypothetical protein
LRLARWARHFLQGIPDSICAVWPDSSRAWYVSSRAGIACYFAKQKHYGEAGVPDTRAFRVVGWDADMRAEPPATSAKGNGGRTRRLAVWSAATEIKKQPTLETNSTRGTIDPGVVVRRSGFETTALEMPAGFGQFTITPTCARWVAGSAPTDRRCNPGLHHR